MAVAFDAVGTVQSVDAAVSASIPITLGTGADRAVVLHAAMAVDTLGITATIGGETMTIISGTDGGATSTSVMLGKPTTLTGPQTISVSWTTSQKSVLNAVSFTGVNQSGTNLGTFNNGTFNTGAATVSMTITSTSGDLTTTLGEADTLTGTNQTIKWGPTSYPVSAFKAGGDIGPGTGTTTHTWTGTAGATGSGCNVVQVAAVSTYGSATADPGRHVPLLSRFS